MKRTTTVSITSRNEIALAGLKCLISSFDDLEIVSASRIPGDILAIISKHKPKIALCEVEDRQHSSDAIHAIIKAKPETRFLMFSGRANAECATKLLSAGAAGYISLTASAQELEDALHQVAQGDTYVSAAIANEVIARMREEAARGQQRREQNLSFREEQIARLLCEGKTNREIAINLGLREKTIKHYMSHMMQKMHLRNRLEVAMALQHVLQVPERARAPH